MPRLNDNVRTDTLTIYKTIGGCTANYEVSSLKEYRLVDLPTFLPTTDTVVTVESRTDTVRVYVPISDYYFELPTAKLWVSGYDVSLDRWEVVEQTKVVEPRFRHHRLWLGMDGYLCKTPCLIVSANYAYATKQGFIISAGCGYEPFQKSVIARAGLAWEFQF